MKKKGKGNLSDDIVDALTNSNVPKLFTREKKSGWWSVNTVYVPDFWKSEIQDAQNDKSDTDSERGKKKSQKKEKEKEREKDDEDKNHGLTQLQSRYIFFLMFFFSFDYSSDSTVWRSCKL
jgi:hypothetical protein